MRPSSTLYSPPQAAQTDSLHPVLKDALGSLDVQLEEELTRYRRLRALGKSGYSPCQTTSKGTARVQSPPAIAPVTDPLPIPSQSPEAGSTTRTEADAASVEAPSTSPADSQSHLELQELAKQYAAQIHREAELAAATDGPNDYLESSEELLRSLAEEEASVQAEESFLKSLSTPLGIGSMLLLLVSSAMFGFVIMNPSSMTQWFSQHKPEVATNSVTSANPSSTAPAEAPNPSEVAQPNLANQEFPDLNLSTLGSLPVDRTSTPKPGKLPGKPAIAAGKDAKKANLGVSGKSALATATQPRPVKPAVPAAPQVTSSTPEFAAPPVEVPSPRRLAPATGYNPSPAPLYRAPAPPVQPYNPSPPARSYSAPAAKPVRPHGATAKPATSDKPASTPQTSKSASPALSLPPLKLNPDPTPAPSISPSPTNSYAPSPSPAASSSPAAATPNGYKVVTPYSSDRALEKAREKVPDAYLQNYSDGAKVQLGAYDNESTAQKRAEELRQQGIPAEVYKP
ncbi:MAG: SPOR domain-containing protein [Leptodesmis sp.]|uniref:SPOR domain-containing protein n=1 Tax=Leptodesmis sp. TaxID=3100501 RepID=UPI003D10993A